MSGISSISGLSALAYRSYGAMLQDMQAAEESEGEDSELMVETQDDVDVEASSDDDSEDALGAEEGSPLGGQIDAWG